MFEHVDLFGSPRDSLVVDSRTGGPIQVLAKALVEIRVEHIDLFVWKIRLLIKVPRIISK